MRVSGRWYQVVRALTRSPVCIKQFSKRAKKVISLLARRGDRLDEVDGRLAVNMLFHDSGTYQRNDDRQGAEAQSNSS